jgi:hypothetical protein
MELYVYRRYKQHLLKTEEHLSHFDPMQLSIFADPVISKEQTCVENQGQINRNTEGPYHGLI